MAAVLFVRIKPMLELKELDRWLSNENPVFLMCPG